MRKGRGKHRGATRARSCEGKQKFDTPGLAAKVMRKVIKKRQITAACNVYACTICGGWHWGSSRGSHDARTSETIRAIEKAVASDTAKKKGPE